MRIVGVDPGVSGAIARLGDVAEIEVADLPVSNVGATKQINAPLLAAMLREVPIDCVVIEDNRSSPQSRTSGKSNFSMGLSMGVVIGVVGALGIPLYRLRPVEWKREVGLGGLPAKLTTTERKEAARLRAIELWPELAGSVLKRKMDHNRAEALLIAESQRRRMSQLGAT